MLGAVISAIASPIGIAIAAVVALGIAWLRFTASGQAALAAAKAYFGELMQIARDTFGGISDALAAGDLKLAGQIAFAGLHLVALTSLDALSKIVGSTFGAIASQILDGDFAGAWGTVTDSMMSMWTTFNEGIVSLTTGMANSVIGVWQKVVTSIAGKILDLASMPGFNKMFEFVSGVDLRKEIERAKGMGVDDPLGDTKKIAADDIKAQADAAIDLNNKALANARKAADDAKAKLLEGTDAEMSDLAFAAIEAQGKLDSLLGAARKKREEKESKDAEKESKDAESASVEDGSGAGGRKRPSFVTFSAAAAVAAGYMGRSSESQMADDVKRTRELAEDEKRIAAENLAVDEKILENLEKLGNGLAYGA